MNFFQKNIKKEHFERKYMADIDIWLDLHCDRYWYLIEFVVKIEKL